MMEPVAAAAILDLGRRSVREGIASGRALAVDLDAVAAALRVPTATFVTLASRGDLRGCIGRLTADRPLAVDVAQNAWAAASQDPRFPPVGAEELDELTLSVALLGAAIPLEIADEADLCRRLRPDRDGLILEWRGRRAVFLPSVWSSLPDPRRFVAQLKRKAGIPIAIWDGHMRAARFETIKLGPVPL